MKICNSMRFRKVTDTLIVIVISWGNSRVKKKKKLNLIFNLVFFSTLYSCYNLVYTKSILYYFISKLFFCLISLQLVTLFISRIQKKNRKRYWVPAKLEWFLFIFHHSFSSCNYEIKGYFSKTIRAS